MLCFNNRPQDAINEVMRLLNVEDDIDAWNQPHPAQDLLERIMAAYDGGEDDWCCERIRTPGVEFDPHHANCLLDEARKLCGPIKMTDLCDGYPEHAYQFSNHCGADVCLGCGDHKGLARGYCGWAAGGGNGYAELIEMGEIIEPEE